MSGGFFSFMVLVHPDQADPNYKHSRMTCRAFVQLPIDEDEIDAIINIQILKNRHDLLVHLAALDNGIMPETGRLKKEKGDIFSECCTKSFKEKFLRYVNKFVF